MGNVHVGGRRQAFDLAAGGRDVEAGHFAIGQGPAENVGVVDQAVEVAVVSADLQDAGGRHEKRGARGPCESVRQRAILVHAHLLAGVIDGDRHYRPFVDGEIRELVAGGEPTRARACRTLHRPYRSSQRRWTRTGNRRSGRWDFPSVEMKLYKKPESSPAGSTGKPCRN